MNHERRIHHVANQIAHPVPHVPVGLFHRTLIGRERREEGGKCRPIDIDGSHMMADEKGVTPRLTRFQALGENIENRFYTAHFTICVEGLDISRPENV